MTDKTSENFALDCNGNKIFVGDKVMRVKNKSDFVSSGNETYKVSDVVVGEIELECVDGFWIDGFLFWISEYFEVQKEYNKEYRLAIFAPDSPIVIACNRKEFQEEFEESPGFVKWLTEWTVW